MNNGRIESMTREEKEKEYLLRKEKQKRKRQKNFWSFCLHMDREFYVERKEVLKDVAINLQRLVDPLPGMTEIDIMNVSLPPRTGKSYVCSLFVTWVFGKFPEESIMRNTVTSKLYKKFSNDIKDVITGESHKGRYLEVFPNIQLATTSVEGWKLKSSKQGISYFGAGIEGSIIGFGATKLSILDDSVQDEFDALNEYSLEKKWAWYGSASDSREEKGCKKLFIGTRWSKMDIVGKLIDLGMFDSERALNIVVPALIDGKSYCESIHTTESLLQKKRINSDIIWEAEWMQNPVHKKGRLFNPDDLEYYRKGDLEKLGKHDGRMCKVDTADRGTDSLAAPIGELHGTEVYILPQIVFTDEPIEITEPEVAALLVDNNVDMCDIESNAGGRSFAKNVKELVEERNGITSITDTVTTKNKHTRIIMKSGYIKQNFRFLHPDDVEPGSQYEAFMKQLCGYTKDGKSKHDDAADSLTGLAEMIEEEGVFCEFV